jgi:transposase-like protein
MRLLGSDVSQCLKCACMPYEATEKAKLLVEAALKTDTEVAETHGVARRSLYRWREQLHDNPDLQRAVYERWEELKAADSWAEDATRTIRKAQSFIRTATEDLDPSDPEALRAVTEALQALVDATQMARIIDARLADQNTRDREADRSHVAGYVGRGADSGE